MENTMSIYYLPDEIIFLILNHNDLSDIKNFGLTCKRYYHLINSNQSFWRDKFKNTFPVIYEVAKTYNSGNIMDELKSFMTKKQNVHKELMNMSSKHYWMIAEFGLKDMGYFFSYACESSLSYYYTIYLLQDVINKGNKFLNKFYNVKPYTLTEMHYAKSAVRYLIHCYLTVRWTKLQMYHFEMPPEMVLTLFLQWINTRSFYCIDYIHNKLQEWAAMVKELLKKKYPKQSNEYSASQIFSAVSQVIFYERHITMSDAANLDTLDITKVWENKCGHQIVIYIIFQALAIRCGIKCEIVVFPNHLFIVWKCYEMQRHQAFSVNIHTGDLETNAYCPFGHNNLEHFKYNAGTLLHNICSSFMKSIGSARNWMTANASDLLGFLGGIYVSTGPYDSFYQYLANHIDLMISNSVLNIKCLTEKELRVIFSLVHLTANTRSFFEGPPNKAVKISEVKKHDSCVLYAVGMICRHKDHEYECIIRGWELTCNRDRQRTVSAEGLIYGHSQPYYHVVVADQSERYIAQEKLLPVSNPTRLLQLEEVIAKEFSYFDGFSYVLNDEKKIEYPNEGPIVEVFRLRYANRELNLTE